MEGRDLSQVQEISCASEALDAMRNPCRRIMYEVYPYRYLIGNSNTAENLFAGALEQSSTIPWRVLLCGCGDVRNVLQTAHNARILTKNSRKPPVALEFVLNDISAVVVARAILLLAIASSGEDDVDTFLAIWADLAISSTQRTKLNKLLDRLIAGFQESETFSDFHFLRISEFSARKKICDVFRYWRSSSHDLRDIQKQRERMILKVSHRGMFAENNGTIEMLAMVSSVEDHDLTPTVESKDELREYFTNGSMTTDKRIKSSRKVLNPTFLSNDTEPEYTVHYASNPFRTFSVQMVDPALSAVRHPKLLLYTRLKRTVKALLGSFRWFLNKKLLKCSVDIGSVLTLSERFARPEADGFDVVETSNLADNVGMLNILVSLSPILKSSPHARLITESLKVLKSGMTLEEYLVKKNGLDIRTVGSLLGLRLHRESPIVLANQTERGSAVLRAQGGRGSLQGFASALRLDWRRIPETSTLLDIPTDTSSNAMVLSIRALFKALAYSCDLVQVPKDYQGLSRALTSRSLLLSLEHAQQRVRDPARILEETKKFMSSVLANSDVSSNDRAVRVFAIDFESALAVRIHEIGSDLLKFPMYSDPKIHVPPELNLIRYTPDFLLHPTSIGCADLVVILICKTNMLESGFMVAMTKKMLSDKRTRNAIWYKDLSRVQYITNFGVDSTSGEICLALPSDGSVISSFGPLNYSETAIVLTGSGLGPDGVVQQPLHLPVMLSVIVECTALGKCDIQESPSIPLNGSSPKCKGLYLTSLVETLDDFTAEIELSGRIQKTSLPVLQYASESNDSPIHDHEFVLKFDSKSAKQRYSLNLSFTAPINLLKSRVQFSRKRNHISLIIQKQQSDRQIVDPLSLPEWPKGRQMTLSECMFSAQEIISSHKLGGSRGFGHDVSLDLRQSLQAIYEQCFAHKRVVHLVSSLKQGFVMFTESIRMMGDGNPVLVVSFCHLRDGDPRSQSVISSKQLDGYMNHNVRCSDEEIAIFVEMIKSNAECLSKTSQYRGRSVAGVRFQCSYLAPLYPKSLEGDLGAKAPQGKSSIEKDLDNFYDKNPILRSFHDDMRKESEAKNKRRPNFARDEHRSCGKCYKGLPDGSSFCSRCKSVYYCDRACQRNDWKIHKQVCG
eukprot:880044_1